MAQRQLLDGRYEVLSECGRGNFAKVLRCRDTQSGSTVAVKLLGPEFATDARFERDVLERMRQQDPHGAAAVTRLQRCFAAGGSCGFVFRLHGQHLKAVRARMRAQPSSADVAHFAKQVAGALAFLHFRCHLVHTDLKPENILLQDPSSSGAMGLRETWVLCDFGSASVFGEEPDKDLIQTRPYRAPEVCLGSAWSYAVDVWSLGCILYEVRFGRSLFDAISDESHLRLMEARIGPMPQWAVNAAAGGARALYDSQGRLRRADSVFANPYGTGAQAPVLLRDELAAEPEFADFLLQCFCVDPALRIRADEAAHHGWITQHLPPTRADALLTKLPRSGYSSGKIRTPGAAACSSRTPLTPAEKARLTAQLRQQVRGLEQAGVAASCDDVYGAHSNQVRALPTKAQGYSAAAAHWAQLQARRGPTKTPPAPAVR